ncbi:hypothetical protein ACFQ09_11205 [Massilia norwichensis]|uniref:Uncharacterized protein n=1 Tax=Massilia norwichensis TaxID=1442366 RepID=A0ABT2ACU2_9BURK|nr:hypothetical protein [Massilia norwichensis]MCS0591967.1 hypothetical protein [Massilia norwichensis]
MPLIDQLATLLGRASRALGFDSADAFPPGHRYAHTRWDKAYFDIPSDWKPERIEQAIAEAITNTPSVFGYIAHPTPRMQRALLGVIHGRLRRGGTPPNELLAMLIEAYASPRTPEAVPGLRAAIAATFGYDPSMRVAHLAAWLADMPAAFDVIDAG